MARYVNMYIALRTYLHTDPVRGVVENGRCTVNLCLFRADRVTYLCFPNYYVAQFILPSLPQSCSHVNHFKYSGKYIYHVTASNSRSYSTLTTPCILASVRSSQ